MPVRVVEAPALIVTVDQVRAHLRIERTGDNAWDAAVDADLALKATAAQHAIDGAEGWLGRSIGLQTIEADFANFGGATFDAWATYPWLQTSDQLTPQIMLPYGPIRAVSSVKYLDGSGALVTLEADAYEVVSDDGIAPKAGVFWPLAYSAPNAVVIQYQAGYDPARIPAPLVVAVLMMTADLNENRDAKAQAQLVDNPTVARLLAPFRRWR